MNALHVLGFCAFALAVFLSSVVSAVHADDPPQAVVDIKLVSDVGQAVPEQTFDVAVVVEPNGQQTAGVQAFIDFDSSRLQATAVDIESGSPLEIPLARKFNNASGTAILAVGTLGSGTSTTFVMGRVTFRALDNSGVAQLSFSTTSARITIASHLGQEVQRTLTGVQVTVQGTSPTPTPTPLPSVVVRLSPDSAQVEPGATSSLGVIIEPNGRQISGAQVFVDFDESRLNVLSVSLESGSPFAVSLANTFDNSDGTVDLAAGTVSGSVTTEFRMATVTFQTADVSGPTSFQLATSSPRNTLTSISGNPEPTNLVGASISVQRLALVDLRIMPQSVSVQPSQPFSFEIRVEPNSQTLTGAQAFLNFNPKSLQVVSVDAGSSSPLSIPLLNRFDNSIGTLDFAAGTLGSGANQDFVLAVVTMSGGASGITTPVEFSTESPRQSTVSVGGDMIQRDLIGMSVTIHNTPGVPDLSLAGIMILAGVFLIVLYWAIVRRTLTSVNAAR